jgi:hypothetical protein
MGLVADFPVARISDPDDRVPVYFGRRVIGHLGPADNFHSAATNVTCRISRRNGSWYKVWNHTGWDPTATSAYVSTARTFLQNEGAPNPMHDCLDNTDAPGPWWGHDLVIVTSVAGAVAAAIAARRFLRERLPRPPFPDSEPFEAPGQGG